MLRLQRLTLRTSSRLTEPAPETVLMTEIDGVLWSVLLLKRETFLLGDVEIDNQGNVGYVETPEPTVEEMIAEAEEIVEQVESEEALSFGLIMFL